ncbi:unnamed protein product [Didymodactylos carnosus]|uniref:Rho-GAP domain-containing protein n=1 Tax=Didymodactylos carnosus TaxID=1234261 RepID=A0A814CJW6_9BILA|nr:unnamed protein product [Didymodactylos carnosus]CAF0941070.1 unnamed protein product [Didymodactylos carnosus]CAF3510614.1 unnamed protein product [Didymodactylos carnosus]CAF3717509.1 unnamed protein product [Didymodactylos carnosus]
MSLLRHFSQRRNDSQSPQQQPQSTHQQNWATSINNITWMNKIKPFFTPKDSDRTEYYNRVRYIRESCKVLSELWKTEKDFLSKGIDCDVSKTFKDFKNSEVGRNYRSPYGDGINSNSRPSILNSSIDDIIVIHDQIDLKRKEWYEKLKRIIDHAKEKQTTIRQTMNDLRENYEKAQKKLETADSNLKKFQTRDRLQFYDDKQRELEDSRLECENTRQLARDQYQTETYRIASEENDISHMYFYEYLKLQQDYYNSISSYLNQEIPLILQRIHQDELQPMFKRDLKDHLHRTKRQIAYIIETCVRLLSSDKYLKEEGLFRIAASHIKQKKFCSELDIYAINDKHTLAELGYDAHVAAGALKQYLRDLPDCLMTSKLLPQWNDIATANITDTQRLQRIKDVLGQLPKPNYDNLCYVVRFLSRVEEHSSENKMTASNLAICIGCNLLYPSTSRYSTSSINSTSSSVSQQLPSNYATSGTILELMILNHEQLFSGDIMFPTVEFSPSHSSSTTTNHYANLSSMTSGHRTNDQQPPPIHRESYRQQPPDVVPNEHTDQHHINNHHFKNSSKEDLLDNSQVQHPSGSTQLRRSPSTRGKKPAPGPPPIPVTVQPPTLNVNDKTHRRSASGSLLDRPQAPPPAPPPVTTTPIQPFKSSAKSSSTEASFPLPATVGQHDSVNPSTILATDDELTPTLTPRHSSEDYFSPSTVHYPDLSTLDIGTAKVLPYPTTVLMPQGPPTEQLPYTQRLQGSSPFSRSSNFSSSSSTTSDSSADNSHCDEPIIEPRTASVTMLPPLPSNTVPVTTAASVSVSKLISQLNNRASVKKSPVNNSPRPIRPPRPHTVGNYSDLSSGDIHPPQQQPLETLSSPNQGEITEF